MSVCQNVATEIAAEARRPLRVCANCQETAFADPELTDTHSMKPEGPDPCWGILPGVWSACCGHGKDGQGYIAFDNGVTIYFALHGVIKEDPPKERLYRRI